MLTDDVARAVKERLGQLPRRVTLHVFTSEDRVLVPGRDPSPGVRETVQLLQELAGLVDTVSVEVHNLHTDEELAARFGVERAPAIVPVAQGDEGEVDYGIRFYGPPAGYEFGSLLEAIELVAAGSAAATLAVPNSPGVTAGTAKDTLVLSYNDVAGLERVFDTQGEEIAAVIMEPVIGEQTVPATQEFLETARRLTTGSGALLVFDEVVTARLAHGGVQSLRGVTPDLTAFGKIIGGGLPVGAFGGREDVMAVFDTRLPDAVPHHGTYNGNGLTMAAGLASLDLLTGDEIERINGLGGRLADGLREMFQSARHPFRVSQVGSLLLIEAEAADDLADLHRSALLSGVYMAPRGLMCISTPMDEGVVDTVIERMAEAAGRLAV